MLIPLPYDPCLQGALAQCRPRDYGKGSVVCVCDSTFCDFLGTVVPEKRGEITSYESNKRGSRFSKTSINFQDSSFHHNISEVVSVVIDPSKTYQTVLGFGGAFTDSTGININALPERLQDDLIKSYYSEEGQVPRTCSLSVRGVRLQGLSMQSLFCGNCRLFTAVSSSALHFADSARTICFGFPWFQNIKKSANYN